MIVIDASVILDTLLQTPDSGRIRVLLYSGIDLHAPHLVDIEVLSALRRFERAGQVGHARAQEILDDFGHLEITRYPHSPFRARIWELRHNISAYDAAYVALSEVLNATLVTRDRRLASSSGHSARIEVV